VVISTWGPLLGLLLLMLSAAVAAAAPVPVAWLGGIVLMPTWRETCSLICIAAAAMNACTLLPPLLLVPSVTAALGVAWGISSTCGPLPLLLHAATGPLSVVLRAVLSTGAVHPGAAVLPEPAAPADAAAEGLVIEAVRDAALMLCTCAYFDTGRDSMTLWGVRLLSVAPEGVSVMPSSAARRMRRAMRHIR
jgi:hypothetical protein